MGHAFLNCVRIRVIIIIILLLLLLYMAEMMMMRDEKKNCVARLVARKGPLGVTECMNRIRTSQSSKTTAA